MRGIFLLTVFLFGCTTMEMVYTTTEEGRPVVAVKRSNFMRVGQGYTEIVTDGEDAYIKQIANDQAMSEELKQAWAELNKTAKYIAVGAGVGAVVGQPVAGGVAGGVLSKVQDYFGLGDDPEEELEEELSVPSEPEFTVED